MGKRIVSAFLWVMATAAVLALILGICYGMLHSCVPVCCEQNSHYINNTMIRFPEDLI